VSELKKLRSQSKTSKYNEKYLNNNRYYPTSTTEASPDKVKSAVKVEERLTNYGVNVNKKIE
jgi:hypothetical protein